MENTYVLQGKARMFLVDFDGEAVLDVLYLVQRKRNMNSVSVTVRAWDPCTEKERGMEVLP